MITNIGTERHGEVRVRSEDSIEGSGVFTRFLVSFTSDQTSNEHDNITSHDS
jgi:hypothetical protein